MEHENRFFNFLKDIPELSPDIYDRIEQRIHRRSLVRRSFFAAAALLLCAIGVINAIITIKPPRNDVLQPEIASELQIIHDYLNGRDLETDLELYTVVEGY